MISDIADKVSVVLFILIIVVSVTGMTAFAFSFPALVEEGGKVDREEGNDGLFAHSSKEPCSC